LNKVLFYSLLFFISLLHLQHEVIAQKTDTIVHINGNVLTGDFKKMVYGVVTWKMDGMGTISMEEPKINTIKSKKQFEIKLKNGYIYFAGFDTSSVHRKVNLVLEDRNVLIDVRDLVEVYPIKANFWMRTTGNFSLGGNYSKGSSIGTMTFSGNLDFRKRKTYFSLAWDDNNTYQGDSLSTSKADISFAWQRLFKDNWSSQIMIGTNQNTELGIKRNLLIGVSGLKDISYNNWNRLYVGAGLVAIRQTPLDESPIKDDLTGIIQAVWKIYKLTSPKVSLDTNINFQPYITHGWRYTASYNLNPSISLLSSNFKVGFKLYYNFDSKPATETAANNDFGIALQLSYSLH